MSGLLGKLPEYIKKAEEQAKNIEEILAIVKKNNILIREIYAKIDFIHTEYCRRKAKETT